MRKIVWIIITVFLISLTGCGVLSKSSGDKPATGQEIKTPVARQTQPQEPAAGNKPEIQQEKPATPKTQVIVLGDEDNLGNNWVEGADRLSGQLIGSDAPMTGPNDPQGTDQIMVGTSYNGQSEEIDGFCESTSRPGNNPKPLQFKFVYPEKGLAGAELGIYAVDFQAPQLGSRFMVILDGKRAPFIEEKLNSLDQTGPQGQFFSVIIPAEFMDQLKDGQLELLIDDAESGVGDGYAVDFARLTLEENQ